MLVCNDETAGHALGHACRARGLDAPQWCVIRPASCWEPAVDTAACIVVGDFPSNTEEGPRGMFERIVRQAPVIFVGDLHGSAGDGVRVIQPVDGWPDRAALALIDLLGLTEGLLPNYENRLRVLGRELDRWGYLAVSVSEEVGKLRVKSEAQGQEDLPSFDFQLTDFGRLAREARNSRGEREWERPRGRLTSAGHEALFRYLGRELDQRGGASIQIVALARSLVISGYASNSPYDRPAPFQEMYRATDLQLLQQRAGIRRQAGQGWIERLRMKLGIN